ncbi:MAG: DNA gyrase inhibitor YacG [Acidobacteria bacterium]|jgi:endogenous inhibitor of DNA gyrase (YacG/DUF329 family)|nr:DNA gyrase inhibitor YacG [Acidobacteriota bacterium]MCW5968487.1 DNA gyrase inhibitor YacG [Blastocatellales bacterium]
MRRCPQCRRETEWQDNPWRPFCSERCRIIDLGRWASEDYRIALFDDPDEVKFDLEDELAKSEES